MKKKLIMIYSESEEATLLERNVKRLKLPVDIERPPAGEDLYRRAAKDKENMYVMGKTFLHGTKVKTYDHFREIFRLDDFRHLLFIEKPPFRFKQGTDDNINSRNCGVMLANISSFVNYSNLHKFNKFTYKADMNATVSRFRKHWLGLNKDTGDIPKTRNLVYLPLQLPQDISLRSRGAETYPVNEMINVIYKLFARMYNDFVIVVREHPYHRGNYKYIFDFDDNRVITTSSISHYALLTAAKVVVSFNSSALAEAALLHKKILYFSNMPVVDCNDIGYRVPSWNYAGGRFLNENAMVIRDYLMTDIDTEAYNKYVYFIINEMSFFNNFTARKDLKIFLVKKLGL